jgi:hypothetical protein
MPSHKQYDSVDEAQEAIDKGLVNAGSMQDLEVRPVEVWSIKDSHSIHKCGDPLNLFFDYNFDSSSGSIYNAGGGVLYSNLNIKGWTPFIVKWSKGEHSGENLWYIERPASIPKLLSDWNYKGDQSGWHYVLAGMPQIRKSAPRYGKGRSANRSVDNILGGLK